ncbi:MAG: hypothetical protein KIH44_011000 [Octadecabacter sp.]|nr:hypothetical protein [Octadecabacter sp.]
MTAEDQFSEELKLKMMLLQEHMKSQTNEEFRYSGSAITSAIIGAASKFTGVKSGEAN